MRVSDRALALVRAARTARPELAFDEDAFGAFLGERPERLDASADRAGELALVFACSRGDATALRMLDVEYLALLPEALPARYRHEAAEVVQRLRERLLVVGEDGRVKITEFTGRGALAGWLRVAGTREAMNLLRAKRREVALDEHGLLAERAASDLELDDLKLRYGREFRAAFTAALDTLDARSRNLLRQHYLDGLTMEAIGRIYGVHRITVVRRITHGREALAAATRKELSARLRVDHHELESILRLIESRMDVSLRAFLG